MTPTLVGRIQTRIAIIVTVGLVWTLIVTPFLPRNGDAQDGLADLYRVTLLSLLAIMVLGVVIWEPIYHGLQQFRWEKDWPTSLGLFTGIPEGILAFFVVREVIVEGNTDVATDATFWVHFVTTWLLMYLVVIGPWRILNLRWRYRGGRVI